MASTKYPILYFSLWHYQELVDKFVIQDVNQPIDIGRKGFGADIEIPSPLISRTHARMTWDTSSQTLYVEDQESSNGTYLNEVPIHKAELKAGDILSFQLKQAEFTLRFEAQKREGDSTYRVLGQSDRNALQMPSLTELLELRHKIRIGRKDCDLILPNLSISRQHTEIEKKADGQIWARDMGSKNGTFVNGKLITQAQTIGPEDELQVGKYTFRLHPETGQETNSAVIIARQLERWIGANDHKKRILREISFQVEAGELVAIMGPSGSGKSTLLRALNGDAPANAGQVLVHGRDFYKNYQFLKQDIGYVPQDDIVHADLKVYDSLYYAARLRLASDVSREEIDNKIDEILRRLRINSIRNSLIREISGGQRKRVCIAVELLSDPSILFLDEPTSPLDPETVDEFLKILRSLANTGTSILMVTHKPNDLDYADRVAFLSRGGCLAFYGQVHEYLEFFQAKNVIEVYAEVNDLEKGKSWAQKYQEKSPVQDPNSQEAEKLLLPQKSPALRQGYWLMLRYIQIKNNDRVNLLILLLQAPVIAGFLALLFDKLMLQTLFLMLIAAIWLGTGNAAREIVSEWPIYRRERMFNLRILPYLFSKLLVLGALSLVQVILLVSIIYFSVGIEYFWPITGILFGIAFLSGILGLFVSSLVDNADKVGSIIPLILLPQIMLAGVIHKMQAENEWLSYPTISRWGMELIANLEEEAYVYYPNPIPNPDYYGAFEDLAPMDTVRKASIEDSLGVLHVPDTLREYVSESIINNPHMLEYPTYFAPEYSSLILLCQALLLFVLTYLSLRFRDRL